MPPRIRIGLIVPSSDATYEPDFYMTAPPNVTLHSHRMWLPENGLGKDEMDRMNSEVLNAVQYLTTARMDAIAYGGTTSSFYKGPGWDQELIRMIEEESGLPAAVTTHSVAMALRSLGIRKLSIATPYPKWNNERLWDYMEESGFEVLNLNADDWTREAAGRMIDDREPEDILDFSVQALHPRGRRHLLFLHRLASDGNGRPAGAEDRQTGCNLEPGQHLGHLWQARLDRSHTGFR